MRIKDVIADLFDFHVMKKKNWTLEQLVSWVQAWEPEEIKPEPFANVFLRGTGNSPGPHVDLRQAEQEWLRVRAAFESRRRN